MFHNKEIIPSFLYIIIISLNNWHYGLCGLTNAKFDHVIIRKIISFAMHFCCNPIEEKNLVQKCNIQTSPNLQGKSLNWNFIRFLFGLAFLFQSSVFYRNMCLHFWDSQIRLCQYKRSRETRTIWKRVTYKSCSCKKLQYIN